MYKIKIAFKNEKQMEDSDMFMGRKMRIECNSSSCTELNKLIPTNFMKEQETKNSLQILRKTTCLIRYVLIIKTLLNGPRLDK